MELGGKAVFWGWREEAFLQGQAEKLPTHILASPFSVQNATAVYEDATKTQTSQR